VTTGRASAGGEHQRKHAKNERERGHENRPQPLARRLDRRLRMLSPRSSRRCVGELDDEDRVLRREPDNVISPTWK
jgi:hypothetical protein